MKKNIFCLFPLEPTLKLTPQHVQGWAWVHEPISSWRLFFFFWWWWWVCVRACVFGGLATAHHHHWGGYAAFSTTWYKTRYPTYASVADWRYAGIQLLFIPPKLGRLIYPDRISLKDLSAPTLLCTGVRAADTLSTVSARQKQVKKEKTNKL